MQIYVFQTVWLRGFEALSDAPLGRREQWNEQNEEQGAVLERRQGLLQLAAEHASLSLLVVTSKQAFLRDNFNDI